MSDTSTMLPQRTTVSNPKSRRKNRIVSDSDAVPKCHAVVTPTRRRWSDQNSEDRIESNPTTSDDEPENEGLHSSPVKEYPSSFEDSSEESDFESYPYPINVHRAGGDTPQAPQDLLQHEREYHPALTIQPGGITYYDYEHCNLDTEEQPRSFYAGTSSPSEESEFELEKGGSTSPTSSVEGQVPSAKSLRALYHPRRRGLKGDLMNNYQVLDILKHAVSMLPPVYARPDPSELGPIASSKSTDTAIKNYRMLPEQLIYPLRGPSLIDRRGEKVFYFSGGATTHWFGYARQHALVTGIRAQEHPSLGLRLEGTFEDAYDQTRELFFTHGADLYYAGRYRCLRIEEVIGDHEITGYLNYHIIPNTFKAKMISAAVDAQPPRSSTDLNPPLDFKAIKELCSKGIIKFEVVALQCMSFDHEVFVALGGEYRTPSVPVVERFLGMLNKSMAHSDTPQPSAGDSDAPI